MSKTFKTQPWHVKASKWNAGNAEPWHTHHSGYVEYADAVDRNGKVIYESGVEIREHYSYSEYSTYEKRYGREPKPLELIPHKNLDTRNESHEDIIWFQQVRRDSSWEWMSRLTTVLYERVEYHRPVRVRVEREFVCTIDEPLTGANDWGNLLPCSYYQRTPLRVAYAVDRRSRRDRSARFNRRLSRAELYELKKIHDAGWEIDDDYAPTAHVVLKRNDWLG